MDIIQLTTLLHHLFIIPCNTHRMKKYLRQDNNLIWLKISFAYHDSANVKYPTTNVIIINLFPSHIPIPQTNSLASLSTQINATQRPTRLK